MPTINQGGKAAPPRGDAGNPFLGTAGLVLVALGFAALIATAIAVTVLSQHNRDAFYLATSTQTQLSDIARAIELLEDAETSQRGFLLTEREPYLQPYIFAAAHIEEQLNTIVAETATMPIAATAQDFRATGLAKLAEVTATLELYKSDGRGAATEEVLTDRGKIMMDRLRADGRTMRAYLEKELADRLERARRGGQVLVAAQIGSTALVLFITILTGLGLYRNIVALRGAQVALSATNANLEEIVATRTRALANMLEQKTALLHEVSHRVSNSLQLIGSLISIQAARLTDAPARDALLQARERVQAVMLVHRRLYTSDEVGSVQIDKYLEAMAEELQASVSTTDQGHRIAVVADPLRLAPDRAVSVGVVVNELVTNALKYAFPAGRQGTILVSLRHAADDRISIVVEDDGVGYAQADAAPKGTGLGTLIIGAMAKTLQGTIERQTPAIGSRTILSFPVN